ncbi:MAG: hypothetical protein JKY29_08385, partial [Gammaproteobacteria bacterium]|nr:hypothetical protein [Gammaproteobacteria bacterium]
MKSSLPLILAFSASICSFAMAQDDAFEAPKTEYGHPDLQGVWNFSSSTPMQRPTQFGKQAFLTREEAQAAIERQEAQAIAADAAAALLVVNPEAPAATDNPGGYNDFWLEMANIG